MISLIENRVLNRLNAIAEASRKGPPKGTWSDIDNGAGGSIYNRREPTRRNGTAAQRKAAQKERAAKASEVWQGMSYKARFNFLTEMHGGYERADREEMAGQDWQQLIDDMGGVDEQNVIDLVGNLLHWV